MTSSNIVGITLDQFIKNDGDQMLEIFNTALKEEAENRPFIITPKDDEIYEYVENFIDAEIVLQ